MPEDDDIVLGNSAKLIDSDGDGVSDLQERLDGTDPGDASDNVRRAELKPDLVDVRGDLDRVTLEREVAFDPTANMPEGMSVDSSLKGLTNVDGTELSTGANHFGVGEDSLLEGRLGTNSPLDLLEGPADGGGGGPKGMAGQPPAGAEIGSRGPKWDLVRGEGDADFELPGELQTPPKLISDPPPPPPDAEREPPPPPKPDGEDPDPDPEPGPTPLQTDPDAGGNSGVGGATPLVIIDGPRVVEGAGGGPTIEGDAPPVKYGDLVTDGGDGSVDTSDGSGTLRGAPDAPVINTINPDLGIVKPPVTSPPPSGGGGVDVLGLVGASSPATAAASSDGGVTAVDRFATEYLADDSLEAPTHDFAGAGLSADLGADLAPQQDEFQAPTQEDPGGMSPDGFAGLDGDDPLDP